MTVEAKSEGAQMAEPVESNRENPIIKAVEELVDAAAEEKKSEEPTSVDEEKGASVPAIEKSSSYKEESNFLSDLKEAEKKALIELRAKMEEAILKNKLFKEEEPQKEERKPQEKEEAKEEKKTGAQEGGEGEAAAAAAEPGTKEKEEAKEEEEEKPAAEPETNEKEEAKEKEEKKPETQEAGEGEKARTDSEIDEKIEEAKLTKEKAVEAAAPTTMEARAADNDVETNEKEEAKEEEKPETQEAGEGENARPDSEIDEKIEEAKPTEEKAVEAAAPTATEARAADKDVSLWGVPLLPSKGLERTDVILLKFLRARDFKAKEAFEMIQSTLQWRKAAKIDSILDEDSLGADLRDGCFMDGVDREGHPVCYNMPGVFQDEELYQRTFGTEEAREKFLRWRAQLMERGIEKLDLRPGGVASMLQITDLKNAPGPSKRELRTAMKQVVEVLQDNYPEFVARNIFINVPFWYYAFNALLSPFLTQRTKSKFVFARPSKVTETLLKHISAEDVPVKYGGLKRDNDTDFSVEDGAAKELIIKAGSTEHIEIPVSEAGTTLVWDLHVLGWEVSYKEEFIPTDEGSYTVIVQKSKKMGSQEEAVRNSFRTNEPGKIVLTIDNNTYKKKKLLYRYKAKSS